MALFSKCLRKHLIHFLPLNRSEKVARVSIELYQYNSHKGDLNASHHNLDLESHPSAFVAGFPCVLLSTSEAFDLSPSPPDSKRHQLLHLP